MRAREAKDFLVLHTAEQAQLEGVPFSDLERRMMYFTESGKMLEDPVKLNEEFEAEYDSDKYEVKTSSLLHHAYTRIKKEDPEALRQWKQAIEVLSKGDHYLSVLWSRDLPEERPPYDTLKLLGASLGVIALISLWISIKEKFEPQWKWLQRFIPQPNPHLLFVIFVLIILACLIFQRPLGDALEWLLDRKIFRLGKKDNETDSE